MNEVVIGIAEGIENGLCVSAQDGEKVYQRIKTALDQQQSVCLSFEGVRILILLF